MSDYEKIALAIDFIRNHIDEQPSLAVIAAQVHLSEYHFQRVFSRWAGVTPKRFLQVLTLDRAKKIMQEKQQSSLNISYEVGLSSSSRLYDHFVQIEAVTPSEYRQAGHGLIIEYGYHETPYGLAFIALTSRGICQFDFVDSINKNEPLIRLGDQWSRAKIIEDIAKTAIIMEKLFSKDARDNAPISLWVRGTNFQINVWRALLNIQSGHIASYTDIAKALGKPKASRAVGSAIGANPIGLIIPCHRVIRQSGDLGGYRWGEVRKHAMLAREAAQIE